MLSFRHKICTSIIPFTTEFFVTASRDISLQLVENSCHKKIYLKILKKIIAAIHHRHCEHGFFHSQNVFRIIQDGFLCLHVGETAKYSHPTVFFTQRFDSHANPPFSQIEQRPLTTVTMARAGVKIELTNNRAANSAFCSVAYSTSLFLAYSCLVFLCV